MRDPYRDTGHSPKPGGRGCIARRTRRSMDRRWWSLEGSPALNNIHAPFSVSIQWRARSGNDEAHLMAVTRSLRRRPSSSRMQAEGASWG